MIYRSIMGVKTSLLGFGAMRLPLKEGGKDTDIDSEATFRMVDEAIEQGVNYFDTAYPYHGGMSEIVLGKALARHDRSDFLLADKFPGHQISTNYDPAKVFEHQLEKCGVDHFDFYLLHNVYENSIRTYEDPEWGIIDYFLKQKAAGRIRKLGFSTHGGIDLLKTFLDRHGESMDFCQIQFNYLDAILQNALTKYNILSEHGIPVVVMEPVRGGKLASLDETAAAKLHALGREGTAASYAFRWLMQFENIGVILSGMSNEAQMKENLATFSRPDPTTAEENAALEEIARGMLDSIPCTGCRYCCEGCPMQLDIPMLIEAYNDVRYFAGVNTGMRIDALPADKRPDACIGCGCCSAVCPQKIDVPRHLADFAEKLKTMPKWADISRAREQAAKKLRGEE